MKKIMSLRRLAAVLTLYPTTFVHFGVRAQQKPEVAAAACQVEEIKYMGWQAQQVSNPWVKLIFVPQNGGRLMQVIFDGHPYLFVNPRYAGKHLPPSNSEWFNYGGDKLWVLPEGSEDEQHWAGNSDLLDDGLFEFQILSQGQRCEISLTGPADPQTGLQFTRMVSLEAESPRITFHAVIKNASGHPIEWSVQSVSQYNTADARDSTRHNQNFWAFSRTNSSSSYLNRYHVKFGPAENAAAEVREHGLFALHYVPLAAELWLDSKDGWLAAVDGDSRYAMVERFRYDETRPYPGKASVIFWTNGSQLRQHPDGTASFGSPDKEPPALYMEAELNSPMVRLDPSCSAGCWRRQDQTRWRFWSFLLRETGSPFLRGRGHGHGDPTDYASRPQESAFVANHSGRSRPGGQDFSAPGRFQWAGSRSTRRSGGRNFRWNSMTGPTAKLKLKAEFSENLLLEATPAPADAKR
jgi:hypothetical protein